MKLLNGFRTSQIVFSQIVVINNRIIKKVKYVIPFDRVVKILFKAGSPPDMINNYLKLIESNEVRLKLAEEFKLS